MILFYHVCNEVVSVFNQGSYKLPLQYTVSPAVTYGQSCQTDRSALTAHGDLLSAQQTLETVLASTMAVDHNASLSHEISRSQFPVLVMQQT